MGRGVFPLCILAWGQTMVGVMVTSFKRTYARTVVFNAPDPTGCHCRPTHLPEASGHSQASLAQSLMGSLLLSPGSWCSQGLYEPSEHLWQLWGLILNVISPLLLSCWGFSFALGRGVSFLVGTNILLLMIVHQRVVILEFSQEKMSTYPSTPP